MDTIKNKKWVILMKEIQKCGIIWLTFHLLGDYQFINEMLSIKALTLSHHINVRPLHQYKPVCVLKGGRSAGFHVI